MAAALYIRAVNAQPAGILTPEEVTLQELAALDQRLVAAVKGIKLLSAVSWPASVQAAYLERWHKGKATLPEVQYPRFDFEGVRDQIEAIQAVAKSYGDHPVADYIWRTAESYAIATRLLDALGTEAVTEHSVKLFGKPGDNVPGADLHNIDAARGRGLGMRNAYGHGPGESGPGVVVEHLGEPSLGPSERLHRDQDRGDGSWVAVRGHLSQRTTGPLPRVSP